MIRRLRLMSFLAVMAPLLAFPASAQKAAPDQAVLTAAKAVIEASGGRGEAYKAIAGLKANYVAQVRGKDPAMADKVEAVLAPFVDEKSERVKTCLDEMEAIAVDFYSSRFTAEELTTIATFQTSSAGKKFRSEVPELMAAMSAPMGRFQQGLGQELQRAMKPQ